MHWLMVCGAAAVVIGASLVMALRIDNMDVDPFHSGGEVRRLSGDHLKLKDGRVVEFAGLRLPYDDEPNAEKSRGTLTRWIADEGVRLMFDDERLDGKERVLAYVYANDTFINERLLREGLAFAKLRHGNKKFAEQFLAAQNEARKERLGIWQTITPSTEGSYMLDEVSATLHRSDCEKVRTATQLMKEITGTAPGFDAGCAPCGKCKP